MRTLLVLAIVPLVAGMASAAEFRAGFAKRDITPQVSMPLWGYGKSNRPENLSTGTRDPLFAKAVVLDTGDHKLAIVGLDLGRAPVEDMIARIRAKVGREAGVDTILFVASHTHHGPALEFVRMTGGNEAMLQACFLYYEALEKSLGEAIIEAASKAVPAKWAWASAETTVNRNRHTQEAPVPRDPELFVLSLEDLQGQSIALLVNFAGHPTNHPPQNNQFSADFPGVMARILEPRHKTNVVFLQGAAGDMQCDMLDNLWGVEDFADDVGARLAEEVSALAPALHPAVPAAPSILARAEDFDFALRLDLQAPPVVELFSSEYGPELVYAAQQKYAGNRMHPHLSTVLINGELAIAGASGEFFSGLSLRWKNSVSVPKAIFVGYCNGHDMYFPTRRAALQGGYGASPEVAWAEVGAGEQIIDTAVSQLEEMQAELAGATASRQ